MSTTHFIEPLDVLYLRSNKLFGDPGSYGESQIPPWPSVAAGAIRSHLLARDNVDFSRFIKGEQSHPAVGTPQVPGPFRITDFGLAQRDGDRVTRIHALPADLVVSQADDGNVVIERLEPATLVPGIESSFPLPQLPVLAQKQRCKPISGYWLRESGWRKCLAGELPKEGDLIETGKLWKTDERVGVGLDRHKRRAEDGKLFSIQGAAFCKDVGFSVGVDGMKPVEQGMLRFGGDGRGAILRVVDAKPVAIDFEPLLEAGRCRIVLTSPGLFDAGWRLPGMAEDGAFQLMGVKGRVVAAAVSRAEIISGWNLARWKPKDAQRAAPTGAVYWIDNLEAASETLGKLANRGLWPEQGYDALRLAEGFNRFSWGQW